MGNLFFAAIGLIFAIFVSVVLVDFMSQKVENKCSYSACQDVLNPAENADIGVLNCRCQCESQQKLLTSGCREEYDCVLQNGCANLRSR